jgi:hypothetical protein
MKRSKPQILLKEALHKNEKIRSSRKTKNTHRSGALLKTPHNTPIPRPSEGRAEISCSNPPQTEFTDAVRRHRKNPPFSTA